MAVPPRRAARILLLDSRGRVLLIRFAVRRNGKTARFWATPGGGVEEKETDLEAARRELKEELGLDLPLTGPVHQTLSRFEDEGILLENNDLFFVGRCLEEKPQLDAPTAEERAVLQEMKWWSIAELDATEENVFPEGLSSLLRRLA